jgi:predicted nucleic acid-binding protein
MARYLADKSALTRVHHDDVLARISALYMSGEVATCGIVDLELLYSARTAHDHREIQLDRALLPRVACGDAAADRAVEVQELLAETGRHRIPVNDLLVAAAAEHAGLTMLHYDSDFDTIASVTGQATEWIVSRGSVP